MTGSRAAGGLLQRVMGLELSVDKCGLHQEKGCNIGVGDHRRSVREGLLPHISTLREGLDKIEEQSAFRVWDIVLCRSH